MKKKHQSSGKVTRLELKENTKSYKNKNPSCEASQRSYSESKYFYYWHEALMQT